MVAWSNTEKTWGTGDPLSAANLNTGVRDPITEVKAAINGTSTAITTFNGSGVGAGSPAPTCTKSGDRVSLSGRITDSNSVLSSGTIGTIPSGYRPAADGIWVCGGDGTTFAKITISTAGTVIYQPLGGTTPTTICLDTIGYIGA